ncbi:MAG: nucleotidyltransferase domain-containing protein [Gemmatimonadota bacterium]
MPKDQGLALLDQIVERIVAVAKPDRIILFGSAARGAVRPDSDIDLLIVKANVAYRGRLAEEIYKSLFGIPVPVDVIVVTPEDIEKYRNSVGTVIRPALREGREIYAA